MGIRLTVTDACPSRIFSEIMQCSQMVVPVAKTLMQSPKVYGFTKIKRQVSKTLILRKLQQKIRRKKIWIRNNKGNCVKRKTQKVIKSTTAVIITNVNEQKMEQNSMIGSPSASLFTVKKMFRECQATMMLNAKFQKEEIFPRKHDVELLLMKAQ
jgi:hypothetical protein